MDAKQKTEKKVQKIVRTLEVDIVLGRLYPRERLVEETLARRFKTKRHVIRQALNELENAGLLVREANKGTRVCEYNAEEVRQLYQVRDYLERQAALLIPLPVNEEDYAKLKNLCDEHSTAIDQKDMPRVIAANKEFHQVLFRLCGNVFLANVIDEMAKKAILIRFTSSIDMNLLKQARDEHFQILDALRANDNVTLADICVRHLQPSRQKYLEGRGHFF
jgi:DNA-binding GntR family transcriptional regulator